MHGQGPTVEPVDTRGQGLRLPETHGYADAHPIFPTERIPTAPAPPEPLRFSRPTYPATNGSPLADYPKAKRVFAPKYELKHKDAPPRDIISQEEMRALFAANSPRRTDSVRPEQKGPTYRNPYENDSEQDMVERSRFFAARGGRPVPSPPPKRLHTRVAIEDGLLKLVMRTSSSDLRDFESREKCQCCFCIGHKISP